jgi:hypothetical protein
MRRARREREGDSKGFAACSSEAAIRCAFRSAGPQAVSRRSRQYRRQDWRGFPFPAARQRPLAGRSSRLGGSRGASFSMAGPCRGGPSASDSRDDSGRAARGRLRHTLTAARGLRTTRRTIVTQVLHLDRECEGSSCVRSTGRPAKRTSGWRLLQRAENRPSCARRVRPQDSSAGLTNPWRPRAEAGFHTGPGWRRTLSKERRCDCQDPSPTTFARCGVFSRIGPISPRRPLRPDHGCEDKASLRSRAERERIQRTEG